MPGAVVFRVHPFSPSSSGRCRKRTALLEVLEHEVDLVGQLADAERHPDDEDCESDLGEAGIVKPPKSLRMMSSQGEEDEREQDDEDAELGSFPQKTFTMLAAKTTAPRSQPIALKTTEF